MIQPDPGVAGHHVAHAAREERCRREQAMGLWRGGLGERRRGNATDFHIHILKRLPQRGDDRVASYTPSATRAFKP